MMWNLWQLLLSKATSNFLPKFGGGLQIDKTDSHICFPWLHVLIIFYIQWFLKLYFSLNFLNNVPEWFYFKHKKYICHISWQISLRGNAIKLIILPATVLIIYLYFMKTSTHNNKPWTILETSHTCMYLYSISKKIFSILPVEIFHGINSECWL